MKLDWNGLNVTLLLLSSIVPFSLLPKKKKKKNTKKMKELKTQGGSV